MTIHQQGQGQLCSNEGKDDHDYTATRTTHAAMRTTCDRVMGAAAGTVVVVAAAAAVGRDVDSASASAGHQCIYFILFNLKILLLSCMNLV